ncbi:MAG: hypothetical protein RL043_912 [Pseudomonadota bacterium]
MQVIHTPQAAQTVPNDWLLKKNCSLSPYQFLAIFGSLALVSLAVAGYWAYQGAWVVVPFAVVECLALGVAFLVYARHANDFERVSLARDEVLVEQTHGPKRLRAALPRHRVRAELDDDEGLVLLRAGSQQLAVGRFVDHDARQRFLKEFKGALALAPLA